MKLQKQGETKPFQFLQLHIRADEIATPLKRRRNRKPENPKGEEETHRGRDSDERAPASNRRRRRQRTPPLLLLVERRDADKP